MSGNDAALGDQMVNTAMGILIDGASRSVEANRTAALRDTLQVCERAMTELIKTDAHVQACYRSSNAADVGKTAWSNIYDARDLARDVLAESDKQS